MRTGCFMVIGAAYLCSSIAWGAEPASGAHLYRMHCAACHGASGEGDGPVADYFSHHIPDLTRIAERHEGRFPSERVAQIIDGREPVGPHGSRTMPVWGDRFLAGRADPVALESARKRVQELVEYLQSMQRTNKPVIEQPPKFKRPPETIDPPEETKQ